MISKSLIVLVACAVVDSPVTLGFAEADHEKVDPAVLEVNKIFKGGVPEQIGGGLAVVNTGIGLTVTTDGMVSLLQPLSTYQAL